MVDAAIRFQLKNSGLPIRIPQEKFKVWGKRISSFLWNRKKKTWIKYCTLQLEKDKAGMALPNLKDYYGAVQLRPVVKWCNERYTAKWKDIDQDFQWPSGRKPPAAPYAGCFS